MSFAACAACSTGTPAPTTSGSSPATGSSSAVASGESGYGVGDRQGGAHGPNRGQVETLRSGTHAGYDRLVVEFRDGVPEWQIMYTDKPPGTAEGSPIKLKGSAFITLDLTGASIEGFDTSPAPGPSADHISPGARVLLEVLVAEDFEGTVTYGIGLARKVPYRVQVLAAPPRLVIDFRSE